jgi:hypothetical protein
MDTCGTYERREVKSAIEGLPFFKVDQDAPIFEKARELRKEIERVCISIMSEIGKVIQHKLRSMVVT